MTRPDVDAAGLRAALVAARGNVTRAADALGRSASTVHRMIKRLGLRGWLDGFPRSGRTAYGIAVSSHRAAP